ncbi:aldehyde dehydrogenase [Corynebacterium phocae]|uniref:Aldehyde dehydrogenase n=1 Tax=Corynebacterium phocae TaxID=161895 RepID=A0A1L7D5R7_9CORY|nr:aldehyde dehydrogenase family protein [Corynebacterium phocae]APT93516.1 aldehyde dehydrogenase [Corynebacterium phocae]KAA8720597.1 aldehyde dehydrogenase family protein [Corynebacterium phocae]
MSEYNTYEELLAAITDDSGQEVKNPATDEVVGSYRVGSVADVNEAVAKARQAQAEFAKLSDEERCDLLLKAADAVEAAAEPLAQLLSREQGKPLNGPNARFEVGACSGWLRATASFEHPNYTAVDDDITAKVHYRPLGVVGAVGPWNWPMMITVWQIAPALRMGNTIVVKPSEYTPLSVLALVKVINSVLPEGLVQVVTGDGEVGAALTAHEDIDKIMFTGSTATGKKIVESSADNLTRVTLELGGNDAGILLDDVDPQAIAGDLFWGAFINTGQTCAAMKRLYVPESLYDSVIQALAEVAENSPMGVGTEEQNVLGPLQNHAQFEIVDKLVKAAKDSGARVVMGGDPDYDAPGNFYPTTLVADIDPDNPLVVEEQFGPALPIIKYTDLDWAIEQANKLDVGLGSSVWSADRERAREVAARLEAGTTWINSHGAVDPRVPFGGIKSSGYGVEFGTEGLKGLAYPHIING